MENKFFSNSVRRCIQRADYVSALQQTKTCQEEASEDSTIDPHVECTLLILLENVTVKKLKPDLVIYLDLFTTLLRACPSDIDAHLLLHRACAFVTTCPILISARNGCIRIIIEEVPTAVLKQSEHNWLALHCACFSNISFDILQALVEIAPSTVYCETSGGTTALNILWDRYAMDDSYSCIISSYHREDAFCADLLRKILLLVEAAFSSDDSFSGYTFHPLLAFAAIPQTTIEMMNMALVKYKNFIRWRDTRNGCNLLHMCTSFRRSSSRCSSREMIHAILQVDTSVAKEFNSYGRCPFMCGILSKIRWEDGLSEMFQVFPEAIMIQDRETRLFPFMAAQSIETIYSILRESPSMISCLLNREKNKVP